ncbi:MAG TPA: protein kinase [Gemmataceae bacterium]|nr:protein kinase [Gemmataceae bacterium]
MNPEPEQAAANGGQTLDETDMRLFPVLDDYWEALQRGQAADPEQWLRGYPEAQAGIPDLRLLAAMHDAGQAVSQDSLPDQADEKLAAETEVAANRPLLPPGATLGECRIEELLGYGGMGEVYLARHLVLGRQVAVKVLPEHLTANPDTVQRFRQEIKLLARLAPHPNVAVAFHAAADQGRLYLVMEYVPGVNLKTHARRSGPLAPAEVCDYMRQAAAGLEHAHRHGIVHRDIKPSNLLLTPQGAIKVLDLGIARLIAREGLDAVSSLTEPGAVLGTLDYLSPEQARDARLADERSDLYSLGCTFYDLLAGRPPFWNHADLVDKLRAHGEQEPQPVQRVRPDVSEAVAAVVHRLLAKRPEDRYPSAQALIEALDAATAAGASPTVYDEHAATEPHEKPAADPVFGDLPHSFGRYQILRRLGKGGMGTVYLADDTTLGRKVALKVSQFQAGEAPEARERFLREARAAAGVQHEGICPVFDYGVLDGTHYITMAYIPGRPLSQLLEAGQPLELRWVARLVQQLALALEEAHRQGVLHRDLKPSNIMLDERDRPRVVDFGLAWREHDARLTRTGATPGTPAYMSPEQVDGKTLTQSTDVYSLGVVFYQLLTGRLPFPGPAWSQFVYQIVHTVPELPSRRRPDLDPRLDAICLKAMSRAAGDRHASMAELAAELQEYLSRAAPTPAANTPPLSAPPTPPARRHPWQQVQSILLAHPWLAFAALLLSLGAATIYHFSARPSGDHEVPPRTSRLPFKGWIDVIVWEKGNTERQRLSLRDSGALPIKADDRVRIEARLNRPAYLYVLWIDADGKAAPVYPWKPGRWDEGPADEQPVDRLSLPKRINTGWRIKPGTAGMETLLLLAREDPLPAGTDLQKLLAGLSPQRMQNPQAVVWFENGEVVRDEPQRQLEFFDAERIDDPVLNTQHLLKAQLRGYFSYSRAVSFANVGKP